jgi:hypothetical protein
VVRALGVFLLIASSDATLAAGTPVQNGFVLEPSDVPVAEILSGGPPRDGIPALDHPTHVAAAAEPWDGDEMVIGIHWDGEARAYPIAILEWHELVNDTVAGRPILVSYCPLCRTGMVFDRRLGGVSRTFGVSGLLYQSDVLLYDRESESLWSQILSRAVTGPSKGERLALLRSKMVTWRDWSNEHPETLVLSRRTGYDRSYGTTPYGDYSASTELKFPAPLDDRYHPKMLTVGLRIPGGAARAYPSAEVVRAGGSVEESFEGHPVRIVFDAAAKTFAISAPAAIDVIEGFWFAWAAFHPETTVYTAAPSP